MNRQLKERIVGATVIVALGIIVIPWLLDGPAQSPRAVEQKLELPRGDTPTRSYSIPLDPAAGRPVQIGGSEPQEDAAASEPAAPTEPEDSAPTGVIQRPALEDPAPRAQSERPVEQPSQPPPRPAPQPVAQPEPEPTPPPVEDSWTVQVGSFSQPANAEALRERLVGEGFKAFVSRVATDAGTMHRVRVGPVAERAEAEQLIARVRAAGHSGARVVRAQD